MMPMPIIRPRNSLTRMPILRTDLADFDIASLLTHSCATVSPCQKEGAGGDDLGDIARFFDAPRVFTAFRCMLFRSAIWCTAR